MSKCQNMAAYILLFFSLLKIVHNYNEEILENRNIYELPQIVTGHVNITTYIGDTVILPCEIANLGSYHVNWLRIQQPDNIPQTLTVGYQQFSRNMRYRVARVHKAPSPDSTDFSTLSGLSHHLEGIKNKEAKEKKNIESWNFEIRKVAPEDQGLYECYIKANSKHKIKANINLIVKSEKEKMHKSKHEPIHSANFYASDHPRSERLSSNSVERISIVPNSRIKLRCNATGIVSLKKPSASDPYNHHLSSDLQWYKDGKLIEQDSRRNKKWVSSYDNSNYMELDLYAIGSDDSGNYQCKRSNAVLKNVFLDVIENRSVRLQSLDIVYLLGLIVIQVVKLL